MKSHYETIIIGGGVSGLSCARRLHDAGQDFLLITEDLGGRMKHDETTGINMGAGFVLSNYKNVRKYVREEKRNRYQRYKKEFLCDVECHSISSILLKNLKELPKILKLLFFVWRLNRHVELMRKKLPSKSIKEVVENDKVLSMAFSTPAKEFVDKHKLEELTEKLINPLIASAFYANYDKMNTYYYLGILTPIFSWIRIPDFSETVKKLTEGYEVKIYLAKAKKVTRDKGGFTIITTKDTFTSKYIVFAAPEQSLRGVYTLPKPHIQQQVHRFIVRGARKDKYKDKQLTFNPKVHDVFKMTEARRGYDIISAKNADPSFEKYYDSYEIVKHIHWTPGVIIPNKPIDQNLEKNAYLASDYNASLLEDCFLTGLYAANQIIKKSNNVTF